MAKLRDQKQTRRRIDRLANTCLKGQRYIRSSLSLCNMQQRVYAFSYVTHRDERWFPDPEHFDPERFLGEKERKISPFAYFPFGAGPRACIGAQFALTEMTLVAACLLRRFEFCLRPGDDNREPLTHLSLRPKGGLSMLVTKRRNS